MSASGLSLHPPPHCLPFAYYLQDTVSFLDTQPSQFVRVLVGYFYVCGLCVWCVCGVVCMVCVCEFFITLALPIQPILGMVSLGSLVQVRFCEQLNSVISVMFCNPNSHGCSKQPWVYIKLDHYGLISSYQDLYSLETQEILDNFMVKVPIDMRPSVPPLDISGR